MSVTPFQPVLPAPKPFTDAEFAFYEDSPPGLFPDNQNSNFGFIIRKLFSDYIQTLIGQQQTMYNERFVATSTQFLDEWERQEGLPMSPTSLTLSQRRQAVLARVQRGPFTWDRRAGIIENFVASSFGDAVKLVPAGIPFDSNGIPLYSGVTSSVGSYRVYENIPNYSYEVWLKSGFTPGPGLTRELTRITPAGITFTIDNTHTDVLDYFRLVRNSHPVGYWRLGTTSDASGGAQTLTAVGGVTSGSVASPGLLVAAVAGSEGATNFDGTDDQFTATPVAAIQAPPAISYEAWVRVTAFATTGNARVPLSQNTRYIGIENNAGTQRWVFTINFGGVQQYLRVVPTTPLATGTVYHVVGTCDGVTLKLYVNGVLVGSQAAAPSGAIATDASLVRIGCYAGSSAFWNGAIDEAAIYNYALDATTVLDHFNTGKDIATY